MDADGIELLEVILNFMVGILDGDECHAYWHLDVRKNLNSTPLKKLVKLQLEYVKLIKLNILNHFDSFKRSIQFQKILNKILSKNEHKNL